MRIDIGGNVPENCIESLIDAVNDTIYEINEGPTTKEEFLKEAQGDDYISWAGVSNYRECDDIKCVCRYNNIAYVHTSCPSMEYDGSKGYWLPGMDMPKQVTTTVDCDPVILTSEIKPYINLLIDYAENKDNIPLYVAEDKFSDLIKAWVNDRDSFIPIIKQRLSELLPEIPTMPPIKVI